MLKIKNIFGKKRQPHENQDQTAKESLKVPEVGVLEQSGSGSTLATSYLNEDKKQSEQSLPGSNETVADIEPEHEEIEEVSEMSEEQDSLSTNTSGSSSLEEVPEAHFAEQVELLNYTLINQIGEGAFSKVFRGIPQKNSSKSYLTRNFHEVAIKVILKDQSKGKSEKKNEETKKSTREQVLREVKIHKLISSGSENSHVVQFIDFQESENYFYIIQELLNGGEIFGEIVKYTYFSEDLSRHVIKPLALAVKHMHQMGVVHRDIKPENLLFEHIKFVPSKQVKLRKSDDPATKIDEGEFRPGVGGGGIGRVKLADFGLSKQIHQTNTKTPCGTVGYTAPEVVRDERYSMEVDMWGIGCVLYTVLCGFPPFYDEKIDMLTEKIARGEYTFLRPWWDEISDGAKNCVRRLLEVDPAKRYSIDDLLNDEWLNTYDSERQEQDMQKKRQARLLDHQRRSKSHLKNRVYYLKKDNPLMYSPAANAMRDAFDVSNALQRNEVEKREMNQRQQSAMAALTEGKEALTSDQNGLGEDLFQLKLNSSTIIKRRKENNFPNQHNMMIPTLLE